MSIGGIGVYDQQPQVSQDAFVVVGGQDVIRSQEITTNGVANDVTYETRKDCHGVRGFLIDAFEYSFLCNLQLYLKISWH